jgi:hypothetical protein
MFQLQLGNKGGGLYPSSLRVPARTCIHVCNDLSTTMPAERLSGRPPIQADAYMEDSIKSVCYLQGSPR